MQRVLIALLLLAFQCCYLRWGRDQSAFVFQVEYEVFSGAHATASNFAHPAIALPILGEAILLLCLLRRKPSRWLVLTGIVLTGLLVLMILLVGILARQALMIGSALPFLGLATWYLWRYGRKRYILSGV